MSENNDNDSIISDVIRQEDRDRQALAILLDRQREKKGHVLALRAHMGITPSYVTTVPLSWVAQHVRFAGDLPVFKGRVNKKSKKVPVDENTLGDIRQRNPDWRRQLQMTAYLAAHRNHKFPPLLVVGWQNWVHESKAEQWGPQDKAMYDSVPAVQLDHNNAYIDLNYVNTNYYAMDGQHRLMAILGLQDLLVKGRLPALNEDGEPKSQGGISLEGVIEEITRRYPDEEDENAIHQRLQGAMQENIGIEIIPAVARGETYRDSLFRLRRIFVDVNENAKSLNKGELTLLDENDGFRVVARSVMTSHVLFKGGARVEQKRNQVKESSDDYTTLDTIVNIARLYLGPQKRFQEWKIPFLNNRHLDVMRPEESEIADGVRALSAYFDALSRLPSHDRMINGTEAGKIRAKEDKDNILFRPIAQMGLASAIATLERERESGDNKFDLSLDEIVNVLVLHEKEEDGVQMKLRDPKSPWFGVLCDVIDLKMRRHKKYMDLCVNMFLHLIRGTGDEKRKDFLIEFAQARRNSEAEEGENATAISLEGKTVKLGEIQLPRPWR